MSYTVNQYRKYKHLGIKAIATMRLNEKTKVCIDCKVSKTRPNFFPFPMSDPEELGVTNICKDCCGKRSEKRRLQEEYDFENEDK